MPQLPVPYVKPVPFTSRQRRAALRMKRLSLAYRIMSTSAVKRANELLVLRHHDGSYQSRVCGTRYFPPIKE